MLLPNTWPVSCSLLSSSSKTGSVRRMPILRVAGATIVFPTLLVLAEELADPVDSELRIVCVFLLSAHCVRAPVTDDQHQLWSAAIVSKCRCDNRNSEVTCMQQAAMRAHGVGAGKERDGGSDRGRWRRRIRLRPSLDIEGDLLCQALGLRQSPASASTNPS